MGRCGPMGHCGPMDRCPWLGTICWCTITNISHICRSLYGSFVSLLSLQVSLAVFSMVSVLLWLYCTPAMRDGEVLIMWLLELAEQVWRLHRAGMDMMYLLTHVKITQSWSGYDVLPGVELAPFNTLTYWLSLFVHWSSSSTAAVITWFTGTRRDEIHFVNTHVTRRLRSA